jgi:hypothetical protein
MPAGTNWSSPVVDGAGTLYAGFSNSVFRAAYPLSGSALTGALLYGRGTASAAPLSSPTIYNGAVYVGDPAGMAERYSCLTRASAPALDSVTVAYGSTVDSTPVVDYVNGNTVFGYTTAGGTGGLVQITQLGGWGCGSQASCAAAGCGTGSVCAPATGCVPDMVPPSAVWLSGGGGPALTSSWSGTDPTLEVTVGGTASGGLVSATGATLWLGELPLEGF